jgi:hypothetical protein
MFFFSLRGEGELYNNIGKNKRKKEDSEAKKIINNVVSHYSPHKIARLCFSHDAINRPSGCQATAVTIDLKEKKKKNIQKISMKNFTQIIKDE